MFSGFPIALGNVPVMWKWATYVSPARWIYQSVAINEWEIYDASDDNTYGTGNGLQVSVTPNFETCLKTPFQYFV